MKVIIKYTETREYSTEKVVEMTKKQYAEYCKMTNFQCEENLQFCSLDLATHDYTESNYEFIKL
jgi:hypothetical protein